MRIKNRPVTHDIARPSYGKVVSLTGVNWNLPDGSPLLRDVQFEIGAGEFVWIKGDTGSGKSTIHRITAGLEKPVEGEVQLFGSDIHRLKPRHLTAMFRDRIGLGFQKPNLKDGWTVMGNMTYYPEIMGVADKGTYIRAANILTNFGLASKANVDAATLSGGQQQQVALGSLLVNRPELLLLDEPTSAMDGELKNGTLSMLRNLTGYGTTIVMVSHDLQSAAFATRALEVQDGRIVADNFLPSAGNVS
jgi:ABC-type lipoprotein export system ATPase subunit